MFLLFTRAFLSSEIFILHSPFSLSSSASKTLTRKSSNCSFLSDTSIFIKTVSYFLSKTVKLGFFSIKVHVPYHFDDSVFSEDIIFLVLFPFSYLF